MQLSATRFILFTAIALSFAISTSDAIAQRLANDPVRAVADPLQIKLVRSKVVLENGREAMQSAVVAKPGDILEETATYSNTSKAALRSLEATLPVPANTELVMASVKPTNAKASTDGKNFSSLPLTRKVRQANGVEVEQPVPLSEYRYLRWYPGELGAEKSMSFSARFVVANSSATPNTAGK